MIVSDLRIELDQNILGLVVDDLVEVLGNNNLDRLVVAAWDRLRLQVLL